MKILGIETSCDETAAAVVEDGERILSNVVVSQIDIFAEYGGVIPEVAARSHLEVMMPVVDKALADASVSWDEIDAIAVTHAPGLLGSLLIGTLTARTLAILHDKPLYAVHHLKSHVYANWLITDNQNSVSSTRSSRPVVTGGTSLSRSSLVANGLGNTIPDCPSFPILALVVSGGHTQILYMPAHNQFEIIGTTRDDAVGECFDKVAKILGLPYPGGPSIAKAAEGQFELCSGPRRSRPSPRGERANSRAAALRNAPSRDENANLSGHDLFKLQDTYGFPMELSVEECYRQGIELSKDYVKEFEAALKEQRERSQTASKGMFKGGLEDHGEQTVKYHTSCHLLLAALQKIVDPGTCQKGSNITSERVRFDFNCDHKLTDEEKAAVEKQVNEWIEADLPVVFDEYDKEYARDTLKAHGEFWDKYPEVLKVYTIGDFDNPVSREVCGGPHVEHTGVLGKFKIKKEESSSAGVRRIKAILE